MRDRNRVSPQTVVTATSSSVRAREQEAQRESVVEQSLPMSVSRRDLAGRNQLACFASGGATTKSSAPLLDRLPFRDADLHDDALRSAT
jgi:hypothetical protein